MDTCRTWAAGPRRGAVSPCRPEIRLAEQEAPMARAGAVLGYRMSGTTRQQHGPRAAVTKPAQLGKHGSPGAGPIRRAYTCTYVRTSTAKCRPEQGLRVAHRRIPGGSPRAEPGQERRAPWVLLGPTSRVRGKGQCTCRSTGATNAHWLAWCSLEPAGSSFLVMVSCVGIPGLRACTLHPTVFRAVRGSGSDPGLLWLWCPGNQAAQLPT